jgi:hypothetical protein
MITFPPSAELLVCNAVALAKLVGRSRLRGGRYAMYVCLLCLGGASTGVIQRHHIEFAYPSISVIFIEAGIIALQCIRNGSLIYGEKKP